MDLLNLRFRIAQLTPAFLVGVVEQIIIDNSQFFEDLQRDQLLRGKTKKGDNISPKYRNPGYADFKQRRNSLPPSGVPDLNLTGEFHQGIFVDVESGSVYFGSSDSKTVMLTEKYEFLFGLNLRSWSFAIEKIIQPQLFQRVKATLSA